MIPPINKSDTPKFYEMDEYAFQDMCRDIFFHEPDILTAEVYGIRGQSQHGIDILAHGKDNCSELGQCKCHSKFTAKQIKAASEEFFKYWISHWEEKKVNRFILFVACSLERTQEQAEINNQIKKFEKHNIRYEAWSGAKIAHKLSNHPKIVNRYLDREWVERLCGPQNSDHNFVSTIKIFTNQIDYLKEKEESRIQTEIKCIQDDFNTGKINSGFDRLCKIKNDISLFVSLSDDIKASIYRLETVYYLNSDRNWQKAKETLEKARPYSPIEKIKRLESHIVYSEKGPLEALKYLADQNDIESLNSKASFYIEMENITEAEALLKPENILNENSYKLLSFIALLKGNVINAKRMITKALTIKPQDNDILYMSALVEYYTALSPAFLHGEIYNWPLPVPLEFIKQDQESLSCLNRAAEIFLNLADNEENENRKFNLQVWYMASLMNNVGKRAEGEKYYLSLLEKYPECLQLIIWYHTNMPVSYIEKSMQILEQKINKDQYTIVNLQALLEIYIGQRKIQEAFELLNNKKDEFISSKNFYIWESIYIRILMINNEPEKACQLIEKSENINQLDDIKQIIMQQIAGKTKKYRGYKKYLYQHYIDTKQSIYLFNYCELMLSLRKWKILYDHSRQLIDLIQTPKAIELAAMAYYNTGRYQECINLLETNKFHFYNSLLSQEMQRLHIFALQAIGNIEEAKIEAEQWAMQNKTLDAYRLLAQLCIHSGDIKDFSSIAGKMINIPDIPIDYSLFVIKHLINENKELAVSYFKKVDITKIPDEAVTSFLDSGFKLGLDNEMTPLIKRMSILAEKGNPNVQQFHINDIIPFFIEQNKKIEKISNSYNKGLIPSHILNDESIYRLYHIVTNYNKDQSDPLKQTPIFIRYGGRSVNSELYKKIGKGLIYADTTSILLAWNLGILESIKKKIEPIYIPRELIKSINSMKEKLTYHQPSRLEKIKKIKMMINQNKIHTIDLSQRSYDNNKWTDQLDDNWYNFYNEAILNNGFFVSDWPLPSIEPISNIPVDVQNHIITCGDIIKKLYDSGKITKREYDREWEKNNYKILNQSIFISHKDSSLFFYDSTIEEIIESPFFTDICSLYHIFIDAQFLKEIENILSSIEVNKQRAQELEQLVNHIKNCLSNNEYVRIPYSQDIEKEAIRAKYNMDLQSVISIMKSKKDNNSLLWIDDRNLNKYMKLETNFFIDITDIIKALFHNRIITEEDYYDYKNRLRKMNCRYISIETNELLYHLNECKIENDHLIETLDLKIIRRYMASCLSQTYLEFPGNPPKSPYQSGEIQFIKDSDFVAIDTIKAVWNNNDDLKICHIQSNWLINNFYIGAFTFYSIYKFCYNSDSEIITKLAVSDIVNLITLSFEIQTSKSRKRQKFLEWIYYSRIEKMITANPILKEDIRNELINSFNKFEEIFNQKFQNIKSLKLSRLFYEDLPETIKILLKTDNEFINDFNLSSFDFIGNDELIFLKNDFYRAIHDVINGKEIRIQEDQSMNDILLKSIDFSNICKLFYQILPDSQIKELFLTDEIRILHNDRNLQINLFTANRQWFDCPNSKNEKIIQHLISIDDPIEKMNDFYKHYNASYYIFLIDLEEKLRKGIPVKSNEFLPPSFESLLNHLRINYDDNDQQIDFKYKYNLSANVLLTEEDLITTISRLSLLPVSLPVILFSKLETCTKEERKKYLKQLVKKTGTPLSKIQLLKLFIQFNIDYPYYSRFIDKFINQLFDKEFTDEWESFNFILSWLNCHFISQKPVSDLPAFLRLTLLWAHANNLFILFNKIGISLDWINKTFQNTSIYSIDLFDRDKEYFLDLNHPDNLNPNYFLICSLSYIFKDKNFILNDIIREKIINLFIPSNEDVKQFSLCPLGYIFKGFNVLSSFIDDSPYDNLKIIPEINNIFEVELVTAVMNQFLDKVIQNQNQQNNWSFLLGFINRTPIPAKIEYSFFTAIKHTNFAKLIDSKNIICILNIFNGLVRQLFYNYDDDVYNYLENQFKLIIDQIKNIPLKQQAMSIKQIDIINYMNIIALQIACLSDSIEKRIEKYKNMIELLINNFPDQLSYFIHHLQKLCIELPINQSALLWPLLVKFRAILN